MEQLSEEISNKKFLLETEIIFWFRYRFRPKRKMAVSAIFGFGRNEKKPFGRKLGM